MAKAADYGTLAACTKGKNPVEVNVLAKPKVPSQRPVTIDLASEVDTVGAWLSEHGARASDWQEWRERLLTQTWYSDHKAFGRTYSGLQGLISGAVPDTPRQLRRMLIKLWGYSQAYWAQHDASKVTRKHLTHATEPCEKNRVKPGLQEIYSREDAALSEWFARATQASLRVADQMEFYAEHYAGRDRDQDRRIVAYAVRKVVDAVRREAVDTPLSCIAEHKRFQVAINDGIMRPGNLRFDDGLGRAFLVVNGVEPGILYIQGYVKAKKANRPRRLSDCEHLDILKVANPHRTKPTDHLSALRVF